MTNRLLSLAAAAALVAVPVYAVAQEASAPPAAEAEAPAAPAAAAEVTAGQPVKDKTGVTIGEVAEVKADAAGAQVATIRMGEDTFTVATASLAVQGDAAVINATQAEIRDMIRNAAS